MRTQRLFSILIYILSQRKIVTAQELADHFNVSLRTMYRDIDTLSTSGVPIYALNGRNGGYAILEQFSLSRFTFSEDEKNQLQDALKLYETFNKSEDVAQLKQKITLLQTEDSRETKMTAMKLSHHHQSIENEIEIKKVIIFEKMQQEESITIHYVSTNKPPAWRKIKPLQLQFSRGSWYVEAYCYKNEDTRQFKLTRIIEIEGITQPPKQLQPIPYTMQAEVCFAKKEYAYLLDYFAQSTLTLEAAAVHVKVEITDPSDIMPLLFMFEVTQIIGPNALKKAYREKLNILLKADI